MKLIKKEVKTYEELEEHRTNDLKIYEGGNELSVLCDETEIVVVGSFMPPRLVYFYNENPYMYKGIDDSRGTNIFKYRKNYPKDLSSDKKDAIVSEISKVLKEQKIAFVDITKFVLTKEGSISDKHIKAFLADSKILEMLRYKKRVISITEDVNDYLLNKGIKNEYIKLFPGRSKKYPKGTDYYKLWKEAFD